MKRIPIILAAPLLLTLTMSLPSRADTTSTTPTHTCSDGTTSSAPGKGACSGHGGVQTASPGTASPGTTGAMAKVAADAATPPVTLTPSPSTGDAPPPTGATAQCKDGTFSKSKHHSGTCSKHGGVSNWLKAGN